MPSITLPMMDIAFPKRRVCARESRIEPDRFLAHLDRQVQVMIVKTMCDVLKKQVAPAQIEFVRLRTVGQRLLDLLLFFRAELELEPGRSEERRVGKECARVQE